MEERLSRLTRTRDELTRLVRSFDGCLVRSAEGGTYAFVELPKLTIPIEEFCRICKKKCGCVRDAGH